MPPALKPKPPDSPGRWTAKWTIEHLIYAVGLPLPTDVPPADEPEEQKPARCDALRAHWAAIVSRDLALPPKEAVLPGTDDPVLHDKVIYKWAQIGTRTFIDEYRCVPRHGVGPAALSE